jgi:hypothetical protein
MVTTGHAFDQGKIPKISKLIQFLLIKQKKVASLKLLTIKFKIEYSKRDYANGCAS